MYLTPGLPSTHIQFMNLEDHNFVVKRDIKLKFSPAIKLC